MRDACCLIFLLSAVIALVGCKAGVAAPDRPSNGQTIAFLGDSITAGGANYGGYCRLVVHGLKTRDIYVKPVLAGIPGNTSEDMLARLESDVLAHDPDWVVLAAGVNDIWHGDPTVKIGVFQPKPGMGVKLPAYKQNITEIVDRCTAAGARVLLTTITPIREEPDFKLNKTAEAYNAFLLQLAEERGLPIAGLNEQMFALIADGQRLTSDGVHPIAAGHQAMARGILQALELSQDQIQVAQKEWDAAPSVLFLGDRQTTSGGRTGGWCHLLMDAFNSGREMVTFESFAKYRGEVTAKILVDGVGDKIKGRRYAIFQAPLDDVRLATPINDYRKQLARFIELTRENDVHPVLVTIPIQDNDPGSEQSKSARPYNEAIREVAKEMDVPLADIARAMAYQYEMQVPDRRLTFDGQRLNRAGSVLMAQVLVRAVGRDDLLTPQVFLVLPRVDLCLSV